MQCEIYTTSNGTRSPLVSEEACDAFGSVSPFLLDDHVSANPAWQLVADTRRPIPFIEEEDARIVVGMSNCSSDRLIDSPHAEVLSSLAGYHALVTYFIQLLAGILAPNLLHIPHPFLQLDAANIGKWQANHDHASSQAVGEVDS